MIQNSLERLFEGMVEALREDVLPAVGDAYARSQVLATAELLGNLATRVEWRSADLAELVAEIRTALAEADRAAPPGVPELAAARRLLAGPAPDPADNEALVAARAGHLSALAGAQGWAETAGHEGVRAELRRVLLRLLDGELERLRTGMYRKRAD